MRVALGQWSQDVCDAVPAPRATDGGVFSTDGGSDAAKPLSDAGAVHPAADAGVTPTLTPKSGCHCAVDDRAPGSPAAVALATAILLLAYRRGRRSVAHGRGRRSAAGSHARAATRHGDRLPLDDVGDGPHEIVGLDRLR